MQHSDFKMGLDFTCAGRQWRCTDIGTRVIVAIPIDYAEISTSDGETINTETRVLTEKDLSGPTYFLAERVFDEDDFVACKVL